MDQQRRLLTFTVLSFLILFGWMSVGPKLLPGLFPPPAKPVKKPDAKQEAPVADAKADNADKAQDGKPEAVVAADARLPEHPTKTVVIGSDEPKTGYGLKVTLSTVGAGIVSAELNDPRYKALKPWQPGFAVPHLSLLGNDLTNKLQPLKAGPPVTGQIAIDEIDKKLQKVDRDASLARLNWEVVDEEKDADGVTSKGVTFSLKTPDGLWEFRKKYEVHRWADAAAKRDEDPTGYQLAMQVSFRNLSSNEHTVVYDLQGPAGLPLENAENASKFRDVKFAFREKDGDLVGTNSLTSRDLVKAFDNDKVEELKAGHRTFQYVGLDTQYFTALVLPQDVARREARLAALAEEASKAAGEKITAADLVTGAKNVPNDQAAQAKKLLTQPASYLDFAKPQVVQKNASQPGWSEVSVQLHSVEHAVPAEDEITHEYHFYLGPKRVALLTPLRADKVIDFSGFLFIPASLVAAIAGGLLWVLNGFHGLGLPYGFCVMLLTVLVRSCMFPVSKKQAVNAKRMKELQPRIAELKAKHADDKQKFAEEQMKLFAETGFNPLGGCLPVFLQLPIFIGLYQALSSSVDLRRAPFLWFDNLAAPDALFLLPFKLPFLGNEFNLLPIITTSLFLFQQKMFMPPPTDEQTRMQAKVFFWMTLMMGFMFYHVPAGLCVYFIASSLWSMGERKLLDRVVPTPPPATDATKGVRPSDGSGKPANNFWSRMRERLEEMGEMRDVNGVPVAGQRRQRDKDKRKSRP